MKTFILAKLRELIAKKPVVLLRNAEEENSRLKFSQTETWIPRKE